MWPACNVTLTRSIYKLMFFKHKFAFTISVSYTCSTFVKDIRTARILMCSILAHDLLELFGFVYRKQERQSTYSEYTQCRLFRPVRVVEGGSVERTERVPGGQEEADRERSSASDEGQFAGGLGDDR